MWVEIRQLFDLISQYDHFDDETKTDELIVLIDKYKNRLANVLCNNPKSPQDKAKIVPNKKLRIDDIELTLDEEICAEANIISDVFTLNELDAVDLILAGEAQKIHFEGLNRGLIAVICYYDAHRLLVTSLRRILMLDREEVPSKLLQIIDSTFIRKSVVKHLFHLLGSFTLHSEFGRLMQPNVNGLGGSKHQKLLRNVIEEIRIELLSCISLICEFPGSEVLEISNYFFEIVKTVPAEKLNLINLTAWLSLIKISSSKVLTQVSMSAAVINSIISHIRDETAWSDQSMCGTLQLACSITLRALATSPSDHLGIENIKVDVDRVIDRAIRNMAFQYLRQAVIKSVHFKYAHQFVIIDELLKQLVTYFPAKLMETERNSLDELAWFDANLKTKEEKSTTTASLVVESQPYETASMHYENFLRCFVDLYEMKMVVDGAIKTEREVELNQQIEESSCSFSTERSIELCRLLERARLPNHVIHTVAYLDFASAVCKNTLTASFLYDIFAKDHNGADLFGWETLMSALRLYDRLFRENQNTTTSNQSQLRSEKLTIPAQELSGLVAWLRVATRVTKFDDNAAQRFSSDQSWGTLSSVASIASSSVPASLKTVLLQFLTEVGRLKSTATRVWQVISIHQLCYFSENGVLMGMQQELEERECVSKQYDVSLAFVELVSTLLEHKSIPEFATPFIQYVTRSILSQFSSRSYNNVSQMWRLAEKALKTTNTLIEYGIVEPRSVAENEIHIALLVQCLNDTPLLRSLTKIIMEDCQALNDPYVTRQPLSSSSSLIALRILSRAIVLQPALRACARISSSDLIISSLSSIVLSPVHSSSPCTLLDLIFQYLQLADEFPLHSLYASRILRDTIATKGTTQTSMLELLRSRNSAASHVRAIRTALCVTSIQYTIDDSLSKEEENENLLLARGETARVLLETFSDAIDNQSSNDGKISSTNNICYYLLAFRPSKAHKKELYDNDEMLTGLHYVLYIIEQFIGTKSPFLLPFSALLEPAFRLLQRLVSTSCPFSKAVLCFLRSSNIIERLVGSPFVGSALALEDDMENTYASGVFAVRRMITGYILHFAAVEISEMLMTGHFSKPEALYRALLESSELVKEYTIDENDESQNTTNLLFSLLRRATIQRQVDLVYPELVHFDVNKLHEQFDSCLTVTIYGVSQYDVAYLDRLLRREIEAVYTDCEEIKYVNREMENILEYCAEINANLLSDCANDRIISGCTAILNVLSIFAPVNFFSNSMQLLIFRDACYVLIEIMSGIAGASLNTACLTFHRTMETVSRLAKVEYQKLTDLRNFFAPVLKSLIELVLQPGDREINSKVSLAKTLHSILRVVFEKNGTDIVNEAEEWLLDGGSTGKSISLSDEIVQVVHLMAEDISRYLASCISDFPTNRKAVAIILMNDFLHEDLKGTKKLATCLSRSGVPRILCEELLSIEFDWNIVASTSSASSSKMISGNSKRENLAQYRLLTAILTTFTRFAASECGWNSLSELAITEILSEMSVFMKPPKELFLKPENVKIKTTAVAEYAKTLDLALHVCKQLCTKNKWKKLSLKILSFIQALGDVYQQFLRADIDCDCVVTARSIVHEIAINDDSIIDAIDNVTVLYQLKNAEEDVNLKQKNGKAGQINANSSFAAPRQLFSTLLPF